MNPASSEVFIKEFVEFNLFVRREGVDLATLWFEVGLKMNSVIIIRMGREFIKFGLEKDVLEVPIFFWNKRFHIFFHSCCSRIISNQNTMQGLRWGGVS